MEGTGSPHSERRVQKLGERFELLQEIGNGGFGVIYQARDLLDGNLVAIKVLRSASPVADGRFDREAAVMAELRHPSVVRYVAHGRDVSGQPYLAMEWLAGLTLEAQLQNGPLSVLEVVTLARRVLDGLALAERKGVLHRDIKPGNLFLVGGRISETKILDFGLSRRVEDSSSLTGTGSLVGTPLYMSPEQARGERGVDTRTDIFSLGCVLYECLTGAPPFVGTTALATLAKICFEDAPPIETLRPDVPARFAALLKAMLAKQASERPSYRQLILGLERLAADANATSLSMLGVTSAFDGAITGLSPKPSLGPRGQRRVLCAVIVGAPNTSESHAPDTEREAQLSQLLATFGARSERLLDGSHVLLFDRQLGASDQALAAAQCALSVRRLLPESPIVVCTGRAVVDGNLPIGELLERSAQLLAQTAPGVLRVDDTSAHLLEGRFELRADTGCKTLEAERSEGEVPRPLLGHVTPFLGRDRELTQLELIFRECVDDGVARAVLLSAPAGSGKSRLRHELVQRLKRGGEPLLVLTARGDSVHAGSPFALLAPALRGWADIGGTDSAEIKAQKLRLRAARTLSPERATQVAEYLGEMIGVTASDDHGGQLALARRDPQLMADRLLSSFLEWLEAECRVQPVLFLVEDLHWSDPASVRFLEAAVRTLAQQPLMILACARPEVRELFPNLWAERDLIEMRLPKLSARACEKLVEAIAGPGLSADTRSWLVERAEGNPFFLEELVRGLREHGDDRTTLPDTVLGVLQARLDALGEDAKLLLRAASIFGQSFSVDGLEALLGAEASRLDLPGWLKLLTERELIVPRGDESERAYVFRHALIRDAAYALLPNDECTLGHRLAAEWLESCGLAEPAMLADHFQRGGMPLRAAHWHGVAAASALEAGSLEEVIRFGRRAMVSGLDGEVAGRVGAVVAEALSYSGDDGGAAQWAENAQKHLDPGAADWWRASQVLATSQLRQGQHESAATLIQHMLDVAPLASELPERATALAFVAADCFSNGHEALGLAVLANLPDPADPTLDERTRGCIDATHSTLAHVRGELETSLQHALSALAAFRRAGAVRDVSHALGTVGSRLIALGAHERAQEVLLEGVQLAQRLGAKWDLADLHVLLGVVAYRRNLFDDAVRALRSGSEGHGRLGLRRGEAIGLAYLALATAGRGSWAEAAELAGKAVELAGSSPDLALPHAASARILLLLGRPADARLAAEHASQLAKARPALDFGGLVRLTEIEALQAEGLAAESKAAIDAAASWLAQCASNIQDAGLKACFLGQIPEHAKLVELARISGE